MCQTKCQCLHKEDLEFFLEQIEASNDKHAYSECPSCGCDSPQNKVTEQHSRESYNLFDLTFPGISLCYPCVIILCRESKAGTCCQVYLAGSPTYHRELWISLYEKLSFDFNAAKALQGQVLKSFLRPDSGWKVQPILLLGQLLLSLSAELQPPRIVAEWWPVWQARWEVQLRPGLLATIIPKVRVGNERPEGVSRGNVFALSQPLLFTW